MVILIHGANKQQPRRLVRLSSQNADWPNWCSIDRVPRTPLRLLALRSKGVLAHKFINFQFKLGSAILILTFGEV